MSAAAGDARRAGPLRAGLHHLHADRLHRAVDRGRRRRPAPSSMRHYGHEYVHTSARRWQGKVKNAQEAHEAIRPTTPFRPPDRRRLRAVRARPAPLRDDLAAHAGLADGRRHRRHRDRCASRPRRRRTSAPSSPPAAPPSPSPATGGSTSRAPTTTPRRRRRARGPAAAPRRRRRRARGRHRGQGPRHQPAGRATPRPRW